MEVVSCYFNPILHSERPKLYTILALLSAIGLLHRYVGLSVETTTYIFFFSLGPRYVVQIGEKTIDYNEEFRLFLTTRNPAPEIPPDAASVITEVNFTTTKAGLTGQVGYCE